MHLLHAMRAAKHKMELASFRPDIIHGSILHHSGELFQYFKQVFKVPIVCSEHWSGYLPERQAQMSAPDKLRLLLSRRTVRHLLPVTEQLGSALREIHGFKQDSTVWRNVVDDALFFPEADKAFDFIHLSTLDKNKRPKSIIEAFKAVLQKHPNAKMSLGGDGEIDSLITLRESLNIPKTSLDIHGALGYEEAAKRIRSARCLVQFSGYENLPCTIGEALTAGLRVVSSNVGGISEVVGEANGQIIEKDDISALSRAMIKELEYPPTNVEFDLMRPKYLLDQIDEVYKSLNLPSAK